MIHVSEPGLAFALSALLSVGAAANEQPEAARGPLASVSLIHYRDGRLSALIENRSLAEVLHALGAATGANVILNDPASGEASVSSSFESQSFRAGVMRILEGFSYAIYPVEGEKLPAVLVLSTAPNESLVTGQPSAADGQVPASPVLAPPAAFGPSAEQELKNDQTDALAREQAQREESLNRAIDTLTADDGKLDQQALDTLVGVQDPRAHADLDRRRFAGFRRLRPGPGHQGPLAPRSRSGIRRPGHRHLPRTTRHRHRREGPEDRAAGA